MGRTKRKRNKKPLHPNPTLNNEEPSINLRKWLKQNHFEDLLQLQLRQFPNTGRGVTSKHSIKPLDVLLRIPFELLITFDTVRKSELMVYLNESKRLDIHGLLALYLVMEKHKKEKSKWRCYIESLPEPEPCLPWLCSEKVIETYPEHLRNSAYKALKTFEWSFDNIQKSLCEGAVCLCCSQPINYLISLQEFKWGYVMVNTRSVYIDPDFLISEDQTHVSILSDEPSLGLCPFLDLINHHYVARTKANIVNVSGQNYYQLTTLTESKPYDEIFISYGCHSNDKLLIEYGFFIPDNIYDTIKYTFKDILACLKLSLDDRQYKTIKDFSSDDLYINLNGVSFILKAILFIGNYPKVPNYSSFIFTGKYPDEFLDVIRNSTKLLLEFKLKEFDRDVLRIRVESDCSTVVEDYLGYRVEYVRKLLLLLGDDKLCFLYFLPLINLPSPKINL